MTHAIQGALQRAVELSKTHELQNIEIEAILKGALEQPDSLIKSILERANIDVDKLEADYAESYKAIQVYKVTIYNMVNILVQKPMN